MRSGMCTFAAQKMLSSPTGEWQPRRLQNATLSMGLRVAPEIMTKMFVPILNLLRQLGMRVAMKVGDLVAVLPNAFDQAMMQTAVITQLLVKLGAVMSPNKCEFGMRMRVEWHGIIFCSVVQVCSMPTAKVTKMVQKQWRCL